MDWFAGMSEATSAALHAALAGREAKERYEATAEADDPGFTEADLDALAGDWSWFLEVVRPAVANGPGPLIDDDLALVGPWGFDVTAIEVPVLLLHGGEDRMAPVAHASWLAERLPGASLRVSPPDGHISVLRAAGPALDWLAARGSDRPRSSGTVPRRIGPVGTSPVRVEGSTRTSSKRSVVGPTST